MENYLHVAVGKIGRAGFCNRTVVRYNFACSGY